MASPEKVIFGMLDTPAIGKVYAHRASGELLSAAAAFPDRPCPYRDDVNHDARCHVCHGTGIKPGLVYAHHVPHTKLRRLPIIWPVREFLEEFQCLEDLYV